MKWPFNANFAMVPPDTANLPPNTANLLRHGFGLYEWDLWTGDGAVRHHPVETPIYRVSTDLLCLKLFFSNTRFHIFKESHRVVLEEVEIHGFGNTENQVTVEG